MMHSSLRILAYVLILLGLLIIGRALYLSVLEIRTIYDNALTTPLDDPVSPSGERGEKAIGDAMLSHTLEGLPGIPLLALGQGLRLFARRRRRHLKNLGKGR